ncbi:MAG: type II toxin-antitoxin system VapC family toxin [Planctomycetes bacterium]|nr:type II toxin-antitoxin system VapC family toxin [Planctomycetota bacterium]
MLFDTDVLIWMLRGNAKAAQAIDDAEEKGLSVVNTMELLQGARNKNEVRAIRSFLSDMRFQTYPLSENIGHRASIYMEEYVLATSLCLADALIAATAVEANSTLLTANDKHYRSIKELKMKRFRP